MDELGYNYRITDFQCALGTSQLKKLSTWIEKRNYIAAQYNKAFKNNDFNISS
ncbi:DegT/DnrJ/EryC1/StrS aminotransferase, partial [Candidatus Magnetoovum chiemensis]